MVKSKAASTRRRSPNLNYRARKLDWRHLYMAPKLLWNGKLRGGLYYETVTNPLMQGPKIIHILLLLARRLSSLRSSVIIPLPSPPRVHASLPSLSSYLAYYWIGQSKHDWFLCLSAFHRRMMEWWNNTVKHEFSFKQEPMKSKHLDW